MATATYINVSEIIDNLVLMSKDEFSYFYTVPQYLIKRFARKGVREMVTKHVGSMKAMRLDVDSATNVVVLPDDYVKYVRISKVSECGKLQPIAISTDTMIANAYLLDNLGEILLDSDGIPLRGSGDSDISRVCTSYEFDNTFCDSDRTFKSYISSNYYSNINNTFVSGVTFTEGDGIIQLSGSGLTDIVVEYIYDPYKDGTDKDDLEINMLYGDALEKYVYSEIINRRRAEVVPANEKFRAKKDYEKALLEAKIYHKTPALQDIIKVTNGR